MLKLIKNNESASQPKFSNGYQDVMRRIVGLTSGERSRGEWEALLLVFRWVVKDLESKISSLPKKQTFRVVR